MIFGLQYALVVGGYAAPAFLLGNYMILYTNASKLELGLIFTIQPAVIIVRPLVCSLADRFQSHRAIYLYCSLASFLCHIPFMVIPFLVDVNDDDDDTSQSHQQVNTAGDRVRFWILVCSHFVGCVCFCCMRTLGDVLTVNYCRRANSQSTSNHYTRYRKFGPISFGVCSFLLGYVNTRRDLHGLPDYVPGFVLYSTCHLGLFVLFYLWPEEFFVMVSESQLEPSSSSSSRLPASLPAPKETRRHICRKIGQLFTCGLLPKARVDNDDDDEGGPNSKHKNKQQVTASFKCLSERTNNNNNNNNNSYLSFKQQASIFWLLVKYDMRIPLYLLILVGCGICGHSVQNFVYVYLAKVCKEGSEPEGNGRPLCQGSSLSGYIMVGVCITETLAYWLASTCLKITTNNNNNKNNSSIRNTKMLKIQLALAVLVAHYWVLGSQLVHLSGGYYFLVESLHGLEFGLMIATSIEWGDMFANKVSLIIPELIERRIIGADNQQLDLVRVSLMATMLACFLLVYDGLGGVIGGLMYGFIVDRYGFASAFQLNAMLAGLLLTLLVLGPLLVTSRPKRLLV